MYFGFKNISIKYENKEVVKDISMEFPKGEITTIIGANGCGKSSILRTLTKGVRAYSGGAFYCDKNLKKYKNKEISKKIAILPQVHSSPPDIDVKTLVSYGRYPYMSFGNRLTQNDWDIIYKTMQDTGIAHLGNEKVSTLSGGERQRAWIAMTICQQPEVLILDEPTTYLDINHQIEILELIKDLNKTRNITIIMVLHDINLAIRYSHYLYVIKNGSIFGQGTPNKIITSQLLEDVFSLKVDMYEDEVNKCTYFIPQRSTRKILR